ncbi:uncharacterized protein Bfra_001955 [Botrytis fragariae]|uniref:Uncharacterized protein n=1 Tax=Botrytis fragariae TaxID=1964551 RepID=A0A8H6B1T6_9HELO|nr:uncharacterized protein Bfra_001955 [Botrytis fragariae]KAF5877588.1 hypothetical protein Bfra_001955 [Botrytis fragariae]
MPWLKITSASFPPSLAGTRDVYTSPRTTQQILPRR